MWQCPCSPPAGQKQAYQRPHTSSGSQCERTCRLERRAAPLWWSQVLRPFLKTAEVRVGHAVSQTRPHPQAWLQPTCLFGTVHHRDDLIAESGVALVKPCGRAHTNGLVVGLDSAQVSCGCAGTVWDLSVHTVGLETETSSTGLKADIYFFTQA